LGVIGDTLFEARTRRAVDLDEVHAATGIRPRYLRAIEEEDWDALPEEFYARSFIRKYAQFLGVDPEPLVEDYRRQRGETGHGGAPTSPFERTSSRRAEALRRRRKRQGIYVWVGAAAVVVAIVVAVVLLVSGGGGGSTEGSSGNGGPAAGKTPVKGGGKKKGAAKHRRAEATSQTSRRFFKREGIALEIEPTAEVWACILDAKGKPLVDGLALAAGETAGPFHSRSYTAAFGNGQVAVSIDGKQAATPKTSSPMGFTVSSKGKLHELPEGSRPTCE
jgi:cytoskeleton protein RodZ